jgi:hypothetical protein
MKIRITFIVIFSLFIFLSCGKRRGEEPQDKILVTIGDKTISVDEFKYRTELTVRPIFPGKNPDNLKTTYLNNLIIEKLFSLESGDNNKLVQNKSFQAYLKGIKEQLMREELYYREAFNKAELDTNEIKKVYNLAGREYHLAFFSIHNSDLAEKIQSAIDAEPDSIDLIFEDLTKLAGKSFEQTVKYKDPENLAIHEALFSEPVQPGTIIGPLKIEDDYYLIMKVIDFIYIPAIGQDAQTRWNEVTEKITQNKASHLWEGYIKEVMKGKKIKFEKPVFDKLADLFLTIKLATTKEEKEAVAEKFWQNEEADLTIETIDSKEAILDLPFFTIDERVWTVRDFRNELMSHPLVYRKQKIEKKKFKQQFQYAIADLLRDHYLTKQAYNSSLDKSPKVRRRTEMWKDSYVAINHRDEILKQSAENVNVDSTNEAERIKYFAGYISSLQKKYSDLITIDNEALDNIKLTNVNLFVIQQQVPFPVVVPSFPVLTNNSRLDYVKNFQN